MSISTYTESQNHPDAIDDKRNWGLGPGRRNYHFDETSPKIPVEPIFLKGEQDMRRTAPFWLTVVICLACACSLAPAVLADEPESLTLTPPNETEVELGFLYSHFSKNRLVVNGYSFYDVIIIGRLQVDEVRREIIIPSVTLRYGLSPKVNVEAMIPLRYRIDNTLKYGSQQGQMGLPTEETYSAVGLGDIELALNFDTRLGSKDGTPFITTFGVKTATGIDLYSVSNDQVPLGTGHWGARLGFATMRRLDPVVVFGGVSYFWNIARDVKGYGTVDPGDTIQYSLGIAYALSQRFSLNARVEQSFTGKTIKDGVGQSGSDMNAATLYLGVSYVTQKGNALDFTVGSGLTEDSPDLTVKIGWPIKF